MKYTPFLGLLFWGGAAVADVVLPPLFSDHLVLQKAADTPVWGTAAPGETVTVTLGEATASTPADDRGTWSVRLDLAASPAGPFEMKVRGQNELTVRDVLVGEVWLASGQSNMAFTLGSLKLEKEIATSANPQIRQFQVRRRAAFTPQTTVQGTWQVAGPKTTGSFSATGYFFARAIHRELKQPVGIIASAWGGTAVLPWTPPEVLSPKEWEEMAQVICKD